jgi:hypothetical protein
MKSEFYGGSLPPPKRPKYRFQPDRIFNYAWDLLRKFRPLKCYVLKGENRSENQYFFSPFHLMGIRRNGSLIKVEKQVLKRV